MAGTGNKDITAFMVITDTTVTATVIIMKRTMRKTLQMPIKKIMPTVRKQNNSDDRRSFASYTLC